MPAEVDEVAKPDLGKVVQDHFLKVNNFIQGRIDEIKALKANLSNARDEVTKITEQLESHAATGNSSEATYKAIIAGLKIELAASLTTAQQAADTVQYKLDEFAKTELANSGGNRMKRSRRSNRRRKTIRK